MHVAPLRSRPGVASITWESLVSIRRCSREHFANNRSAQSLFIYIDYIYYPSELLQTLGASSGPNHISPPDTAGNACGLCPLLPRHCLHRVNRVVLSHSSVLLWIRM